MIDLQTAKQRVVDATAELVKLKSERIEIESRSAKAEADRLANKADQKLYKSATNRLGECGVELDRVGLLVGEAEAELESAVAAERLATFEADDAKLSASIAALDALELACAWQLGGYIDALDELDRAARKVAAESYRMQQTVEPAYMRNAFSMKHYPKLKLISDLLAKRPVPPQYLSGSAHAAAYNAGKQARRDRAA